MNTNDKATTGNLWATPARRVAPLPVSVRRGLALTKRELDCQGYHSLCYERTRQCMDNAAVLAVHTGTVALAGVVKNPCVLEFLGLI